MKEPAVDIACCMVGVDRPSTPNLSYQCDIPNRSERWYTVAWPTLWQAVNRQLVIERETLSSILRREKRDSLPLEMLQHEFLYIGIGGFNGVSQLLQTLSWSTHLWNCSPLHVAVHSNGKSAHVQELEQRSKVTVPTFSVRVCNRKSCSSSLKEENHSFNTDAKSRLEQTLQKCVSCM